MADDDSVAEDEPNGTPVKASEFFFKATGTLIVLLITIALGHQLIPHSGQEWGIYRPLGILTFMCAASGIIFSIWES